MLGSSPTWSASATCCFRLHPLQPHAASNCIRFSYCSLISCCSRSRPLELLLPDCICFSCCSPIMLLLADCIHFSCCFPIAPLSAAAPRLHAQISQRFQSIEIEVRRTRIHVLILVPPPPLAHFRYTHTHTHGQLMPNMLMHETIY